MNDICIFFQAPAELPYVIQLYDEYKDRYKVTIVVVNVYNNYKFIKSLNLVCANIIFCDWPYKDGRIYLKIPVVMKRLTHFWNLYLAKISDGDVYFFSASFDWVTAYFVKRFKSKENIKIHYAGFNTTELILNEGYENGTMNKGLGIRDYIYLTILKLITGIWFDYLKKIPCISFPYYKYGILHEPFKLKSNAISSYKYKINGISEKSVLLFMTSWSYEGEEMMNYVDKKICEIIKAIHSRGFQIVAKGHPRLGMARRIEQAVDVVIPNFVPAEFVCAKNIKMVLGINSAALIYFANYTSVKVVSMLSLIDKINSEIIADNKKLLSKMCDNRILLPKSQEELFYLLEA